MDRDHRVVDVHEPHRTRWSIALVAVVVAGVGLWFVSSSTGRGVAAEDASTSAATQKPGQAPREQAHAEDERTLPSAPPTVQTARDAEMDPTAVESAELPSPEPSEVAAQGLNVVGPGPHDPHEPGMVPHPLDDARARIAAENRLLQSLNDAMSFRRVNEMRAMLEQYRKLEPNDVDGHQLGYEVIADCIEFPGSASRTAAQEFYDTQRHSPLRRFVRRICFENAN